MSSYHMEALRRQRMLDRARQAHLSTVDHEIPAAPSIVEETRSISKTSESHKDTTRPSTIAPTVSTTIKLTSESDTASRQTTRPASGKNSSRSISRPSSARIFSTTKGEVINEDSTTSHKSRASSRPVSASAVSNCTRSNSQTSHSRLSSKHSGSTTPKSTAVTTEITRSALSNTGTNNLESKAETYLSGKKSSRTTSGVGSTQCSMSKAEMRVRQDLHKQGLVLRDSNLVMGEIPLEEEMQ